MKRMIQAPVGSVMDKPVTPMNQEIVRTATPFKKKKKKAGSLMAEVMRGK